MADSSAPLHKNEIIASLDGTAWIITNKGERFLIDAEDIPLVSNYLWYGYAGRKTRYAGAHVRRANGKDRVVNLHTLLVYGVLEERSPEVDHEDGDGTNNRRGNLRKATPGENRRNRGKTKANTSGFKVVFWNGRKWSARIVLRSAQHHIGVFADPEAAAHAYDAVAVQFHGEFAVLNFPKPGVV